MQAGCRSHASPYPVLAPPSLSGCLVALLSDRKPPAHLALSFPLPKLTFQVVLGTDMKQHFTTLCSFTDKMAAAKATTGDGGQETTTPGGSGENLSPGGAFYPGVVLDAASGDDGGSPPAFEVDDDLCMLLWKVGGGVW